MDTKTLSTPQLIFNRPNERFMDSEIDIFLTMENVKIKKNNNYFYACSSNKQYIFQIYINDSDNFTFSKYL